MNPKLTSVSDLDQWCASILSISKWEQTITTRSEQVHSVMKYLLLSVRDVICTFHFQTVTATATVVASMLQSGPSLSLKCIFYKNTYN